MDASQIGKRAFLFNAYNYVLGKFEKQLNRDEKRTLREELVEAMELSPKVGPHVCDEPLPAWHRRRQGRGPCRA